MTIPTPEWQARILARYRSHPDETVPERAAAIGVSPFYLEAVVRTDGFRELLAREGLAGAPPEALELRPTDHLFTMPGPAAPAEEIAQLDKSAFGEPEKKELYTGQKGLQWSHASIIDFLIENPGCTKTMIAGHFGFSKPWVSRMMASTAFREALAKRKAEIIDPALVLSVEETINSLIFASADVIHDRIAAGDVKVALRALETASKAVSGMGRNAPVAVNNYIAVVPPKMASAEEWSRQYQSPVLVENK